MLIMMKAKKSEKKDQYMLLLYVLLVILIIAYIFTSIVLLGVFAFLLFIAILVIEFRISLKSEGAKKTTMDIIIAVVFAVVVFWVIPSALLQTTSPINVVASCSMLPVMHRGDLVLLHGIKNTSEFLQKYNIPVVNVSQQQFSGMVDNMHEEFLAPLPYTDNNILTANPSGIITDSNIAYQIGMFRCIGASSCYISPDSQPGLIKYNYGIANVVTPSGTYEIVYVPSIVIGNTNVTENYSNPIIVYKTIKNDSFYPEVIIHRVFAALKVGNSYYFLTKGDNNAVLDIEAGNYPINSSDVLGYVVASVPYLAYPSLIIRGEVGSVPGCNQTIVRN